MTYRCLVHLSRHGVEVGMFAPDQSQMHVVNHLTGQPVESESRYSDDDVIEIIRQLLYRNVLVESARIARGTISSLNELNIDQFSAVVLPGGFGAAKNL